MGAWDTISYEEADAIANQCQKASPEVCAASPALVTDCLSKMGGYHGEGRLEGSDLYQYYSSDCTGNSTFTYAADGSCTYDPVKEQWFTTSCAGGSGVQFESFLDTTCSIVADGMGSSFLRTAGGGTCNANMDGTSYKLNSMCAQKTLGTCCVIAATWRESCNKDFWTSGDMDATSFTSLFCSDESDGSDPGSDDECEGNLNHYGLFYYKDSAGIEYVASRACSTAPCEELAPGVFKVAYFDHMKMHTLPMKCTPVPTLPH